jgi:hypothetical protein
VKLVPDNYPHEECAGDLERGVNYLGNLGVPKLDAMLDRGITVMVPCQSCQHEGRVHLLAIKKKGQRFRVSASERLGPL